MTEKAAFRLKKRASPENGHGELLLRIWDSFGNESSLESAVYLKVAGFIVFDDNSTEIARIEGRGGVQKMVEILKIGSQRLNFPLILIGRPTALRLYISEVSLHLNLNS